MFSYSPDPAIGCNENQDDECQTRNICSKRERERERKREREYFFLKLIFVEFWIHKYCNIYFVGINVHVLKYWVILEENEPWHCYHFIFLFFLQGISGCAMDIAKNGPIGFFKVCTLIYIRLIIIPWLMLNLMQSFVLCFHVHVLWIYRSSWVINVPGFRFTLTHSFMSARVLAAEL